MPVLKRFSDPSAYRPNDVSLAKTLDRLEKMRLKDFHPWSFPTSRTPSFLMRIVPKKVLSKPDVGPHTVAPKSKGRADMSIHFTISKKVHRLAVVRSKIRYRIQEALGMIVTRGANGVETEQGMEIMEQDIGAERWILRGWTYAVFPNLSAYRVPLPNLVMDLRTALDDLNGKAKLWERRLSHHNQETMRVRAYALNLQRS